MLARHGQGCCLPDGISFSAARFIAIVNYSKLGTFGLLINGFPYAESPDGVRRLLRPETLTRLERVGYSGVWVAALNTDTFGVLEEALESTTRIAVGAGIANIWVLPVNQVAALYHRAEHRFPGRFMLGVGAGHAEHVGDAHRRPYSAVVEYVDALDQNDVPGKDLVLAALRGKMLRLSAERTAGAIPTWMPASHTRQAREVLGQGPFLAAAPAVVFEEEPARAREIARPVVQFYAGLVNYVNAWREFGFPELQVGAPVSDELIDAIVLHGNSAQIAAGLREHLDAGADHVALNLLGYNPERIGELTALAEEPELHQWFGDQA